MTYFQSPEFQQQLGAAITPTGMGAEAPTAWAAPTLGGMGPFGWAGIGAGLGGILGGLFGGRGPSPEQAASPYFQQALQQMYGIQRQLPGYFQPYMQAGQWAMPRLEQQYAGLVQDPSAVMGKIGAGFRESPGYQFQLQQALQAANRAAAAGGMAGSPAEQQAMAGTARGLAAQDYQNYLARALGLYQTGLTGMGRLGQMGLAGAGGLAQGMVGTGADIANIFGAQAQLAAAQAEAQQQQSAQEAAGIGSIIGGIGGAVLPFIKL